MQRRVKATNVTIEGNIFPITSMAYIEDEKFRLSIVVDHAQAAASWHQVNGHFLIQVFPINYHDGFLNLESFRVGWNWLLTDDPRMMMQGISFSFLHLCTT